MGQFARLSTAAMAPRDRLANWNAQLWDPVAPFRTSTPSPSFDAEACFGSIGSVHVIRISAGPHRLERPANISAHSCRGLANLVVQQKGVTTLSQAGREVILEPGNWTLCDADRAFTLASETGGEQLIMLLPRERIASAGNLAQHVARRFGDKGGTARLLPVYLAGLVEELSQVDLSNGIELADVAAQLVRLALIEARDDAPTTSMRETLRLRVKDYVRRNVRDPALSIDRIASAFHCTKRHLHKAFSDDEQTLSQFIWSERLDRCREALRDQRQSGRSITEIAFTWGFNNAAHFSKAFKERFGAPPGRFRAGL